MFDACLNILLSELNAYINAKTGLTEDRVIYANPQEYDRFLEGKQDGKVLMSVVDLFQENLNSGAKSYIPQGNRYISQNQPVIFSIYVLFSTYFKANQALEGIKYLTRIIAFFQAKNYFSQQNTPAFQQADLEHISVSLVNLSYQEKSALWSYLGVAYKPSVVYKVGMIKVADDMELLPDVAAIQKSITVRTD